jgi:outer membrane lipoprotein-sorting protein
MRIDVRAIVGLAVGLGLAGGVHAETLELAELMAKFAASRGVEAEFREEKILPLLTEPLVAEGVFYFAPPDRMVRFTRTPEPASMLLDGNRLRIEDSLGVEEIDLGAEPTAKQLVSQLLVLLRGDLAALERDYRVSYSGTPAHWTLDLATKSLRVRPVLEGLLLEGQAGRLDEMVLRGANGETTRTRYMRVVTDRAFGKDELSRLFPAAGSPRALDPAPAPAPGS